MALPRNITTKDTGLPVPSHWYGEGCFFKVKDANDADKKRAAYRASRRSKIDTSLVTVKSITQPSSYKKRPTPAMRKCENPECSNDFVPSRRDVRFCSSVCSKRVYQIRENEKRRAMRAERKEQLRAEGPKAV